MKRSMFAGLALFSVAGSAAIGPNAREAGAVLKTICPAFSGKISRIRCEGYDEEPTEFSCKYQIVDREGRRRTDNTSFAIDGRSWILIDQPGYCPGRK